MAQQQGDDVKFHNEKDTRKIIIYGRNMGERTRDF
jgi:hypothetical protein